ncbi:hypothetical protein U1E44_04215 [Arenibacter sp. GZD96]|uniref:hypothetical protein n=1 Tax=Aurantibrevibacter litoralis TaxID=3106030 RepID=UPI002AFF118D|nr:hypothetical protein [Arenibacter sp. GZD-96]MEA1785286.1 hypothetical protein [Arenibacter sp. GZD-96]
MLKKILKIALGLIVLVIAIFGILYFMYNEPLPKGTSGAEADQLAYKMLEAINYSAYEKTQFLEWTFAGGKHRYFWDKKNSTVRVAWDTYVVDLHLQNHAKSTVLKNKHPVSGSEKAKRIATAISYFNNDSFWLVAPFKVFDAGTERRSVHMPDGTLGLLVTYTTGGSTPGDSYLWKLNENGFPESFKMWVNIIPIGGLKATWDDWRILESGAFLPSSHQLGPITLDMGNVKAYTP